MKSMDHMQEIFPSLEHDSLIDDLGNIIVEYPYFPLARLYLLQQVKSNVTLSETQGTKTALYFNNINWLSWQLKQTNEHHVDAGQEPVQTKNIHPDDQEIKGANTGADPIVNKKKEEDTITFEPLHTTDYFASQGIKITDEPVANDKLGTQMKSFTEWLKSMKKIHTEKIPVEDEQTDIKIRNIAEDSNTSTGVLTEAMADVLVKQNKTEKAIELYRELSLINPGKSAYFAAKIESLKTP